MLETVITFLAIICSLGVASLSLFRWQRTDGYKATIYLVVGVFAGFVALLNLSTLLASEASFVRTATLAYVGFATVIVLPAARALSKLTYEAPEESEGEDASV